MNKPVTRYTTNEAGQLVPNLTVPYVKKCNHEFRDKDIETVLELDNGCVGVFVDGDAINLTKEDIVALANFARVTSEDLL